MQAIKKYMNRLFIDGLSGMALGLFSTLIVGTIIQRLGIIVGGEIGNYLVLIGKVAASVTGAGIGCGVAYKLKGSPLVIFSAATTGMVGAFASKILAGGLIVNQAVTLQGPGEPLGAFVAAYIGIEVGRFLSGKTKLDILVTPLSSILSGGAMGLLVGPPISKFMADLGAIINWATEQHRFMMGIVIAVLMGMFLTLPISSAAICIVLNISGIAAGAATVGCCANMVGFAVASYRENKMGGLLAQGLGTSMLQVPNIVRNPLIWIPAILTSAILGPISTCIVGLTNDAQGAGMGTCGLVGQIMTFQTMAPERGTLVTLFLILVMQILAPAILSYLISEVMRKKQWIKEGDMKLEV